MFSLSFPCSKIKIDELVNDLRKSNNRKLREKTTYSVILVRKKESVVQSHGYFNHVCFR